MEEKKILWINPIGQDSWNDAVQDYLESAKSSGTSIETISLERGPQHLEYHYYEQLIALDTLHKIKKAEKKGYDGVVIGCFYDPVLQEAREITNNICVTAPAEASMHIATTIGHSFSIIVGRKKWIPKMHANIVCYGFNDRLASFKSVDLGVLEFQADPAETEKRLRDKAFEAVEKDGAEVIILGCTLEFGFYKQLQEELKVPVIDAILAPLKYIEFMIDLKKKLNWNTSKAYGYESPPLKEITEWNIEEQYNIKGVW